jgi:hypothetical protein
VILLIFEKFEKNQQNSEKFGRNPPPPISWAADPASRARPIPGRIRSVFTPPPLISSAAEPTVTSRSIYQLSRPITG